MCLVVFRILAYRADLVEKTFELSAAVSAPAVFYICRLLSLGIRRKCPVIRLDLAVAYIQELRAVIDKYSKSEENGKNRSFSIISAPVTNEEKK